MDQLTTLLSKLRKLQSFKKPLSDLFDDIIYSNPSYETDEGDCEFFLLSEPREKLGKLLEPELDAMIETQACKLAELLSEKENRLKNQLTKYLKK